MASNDLSNQCTGSSIDDHSNMADEQGCSTHFTGTYEVQECLEGQSEVDLHTYKLNCEKNPGHKKFIPVNKLCVKHFPPGYQDNDLCDVIKAAADLTVRIAVEFTSPDRPEFIPGTTDTYPGYSNREKNSMFTGTGLVWNVTKHTVEDDGNTCPCPEDVHSHTPSKVWWEVGVQTARHVVFDESEAKKSSCRLWFDEDESPVVKLHGWKEVTSNTERDWFVLQCVTHDANVVTKLEDMIKRFNGLHEKLCVKYESLRDVDKLIIIVSHPHGCSKQVSVGKWVERQVISGYQTKYTYDTCTCPGSSGALVYRVGCGRSKHPHSGANTDPNSVVLNYSGVMLD
ncbi:uncharacterized protein LOC131936663 [Physella acuta]|uniref:uncharacterized protein LOC131936663 n=1 Tax=Physella acuta TaxID=109671 RepID=UPI0027DE9F91|nr:uncharacterized protein LOC131936663 [Physella acuta]